MRGWLMIFLCIGCGEANEAQKDDPSGDATPDGPIISCFGAPFSANSAPPVGLLSTAQNEADLCLSNEELTAHFTSDGALSSVSRTSTMSAFGSPISSADELAAYYQIGKIAYEARRAGTLEAFGSQTALVRQLTQGGS
jgi:hypothetical protein